MEIAFIVLVIMLIACAIGWSKTLKEKEHYRHRVIELTNGEEGSYLMKVKPDHYPPPPPPKDTMERKVNAIIINSIQYDLVKDEGYNKCDRCALLEICNKIEDHLDDACVPLCLEVFDLNMNCYRFELSKNT